MNYATHPNRCTCLYCGIVTGISDRPGRKTVCGRCVWAPERSEARELAAGMRPWARPLSFWVHFFGQTPVDDETAAHAQAKWDAEQQRIREFNDAHMGACL
jgi:hypothetical protein